MQKNCFYKIRRRYTGRSMIEMLAVLAVIGMLTIGALVGLRSAKESYQTTAIIDEALTQAGLISSWRYIPTKSDGKTINLSFKNTTGRTWVRELGQTSKGKSAIILTFKNTNAELCDALIDAVAQTKSIDEVYVGSVGQTTCSDQMADVSFVIKASTQKFDGYNYYAGTGSGDNTTIPSVPDLPSDGCQGADCCHYPNAYDRINDTCFYCPSGNPHVIGEDETPGSAYVECCSSNQYFVEQDGCYDCPSGVICQGEKIVGCLNGSALHAGNTCCSASEYWADSQCTECPANATCDGGSVVCKTGYQKHTASNGITSCCDKSTQFWNGSACNACPANATCDGSNFTCDDGYLLNSSKTACLPPSTEICNAGYYNDGLECVACPAGQYTDIEGQRSCKACPVGTFNASSGSTGCESCPAGHWSASSGATSCTACPIGSYRSASMTNGCELCANGYYNNQTGAVSCTICPAGTIGAGTGATACSQCPAGTFSNAGDATCSDCPAGTYNPSTGQSACFACPENTYSAGGKITACTPCPVGTYTSVQGASSCTACTVGQTCPTCEDIDSVWDGTACQFVCPANATCDGTTISCNAGYILENNKCVACTVGDYCSSCPSDNPTWNGSKCSQTTCSTNDDCGEKLFCYQPSIHESDRYCASAEYDIIEGYYISKISNFYVNYFVDNSANFCAAIGKSTVKIPTICSQSASIQMLEFLSQIFISSAYAAADPVDDMCQSKTINSICAQRSGNIFSGGSMLLPGCGYYHSLGQMANAYLMCQ